MVEKGRRVSLDLSLDKPTVNRLKNATKLSEPDIIERYEEFNRQFSDKGISVTAFQQLSLAVLDEAEVDEFVTNVFRMFDVDKNQYLTFEEFTLATEVHASNGNPLEKLSWLFDNIYDKVHYTLLAFFHVQT